MSLPIAAAGPSAYWYLTRGTGIVALVLLTASVVLGVMGSVRFVAPRWPRFAVDTVHRDISLLVITVLAVHIITSVLDSFAPITLMDTVVPFTGAYRPLWLGLGALSFDLLLAVAITSLVRRRLGYRTWRAVHWLAYASWPVAVLHGLGTGTDTKVGWNLALTAACAAAVLVAVWTRIGRAQAEPESVRAPALVLSLLIPVGIAAFTVSGPLQHGWAKRAGTPASLLSHAPGGTAAVPRAVVKTSTAPTLKPPFGAQLAGKLTQTQEPGGAIVDLALRLSGGARGQLRVLIGGLPLQGGGLQMSGSQVALQAPGLASVMVGQITALQGTQFDARVTGGGAVFDLHANLNLDSATNAVTGSLTAANGAGQ